MRCSRKLILLIVPFLLALTIAGCSRDPNVRKQKYYESGKRYVDKQQYREAVIQFSNALQVDPRFVPAHVELAHAYERMGSWSSAYHELQRAVEFDPNNMDARVDLGNLLLGARQVDKAREQADAVIAKAPDSAKGHALMANILAANKDVEGATKEIQKAIGQDPNNANFMENLAAFQLMTPGDGALAEESLKHAVQLDPKGARPRLILGRFYMRQSRWAEAEKQFRDAILADPKNIRARVNLADLFVAQKQNDKAEQLLRDSSNELADNAEGRRLLADYYIATGQVDKAVAEYGRLVEAHKKEPALKRAYVQLLLDTHRDQQAEPLVDELLKANVKDIEATMFRGVLLERHGKAAEAVTLLQEAVKDNPQNAYARYQLGLASIAKGDTNLAKEQWREAVRLAPSMMQAQQALARLAIATQDLQLLSDTSDNVIKIRPVFPDAYLWRAMVEANRKQPDKAETDVKKAIALAPESSAGYEALGRLYLSQKKIAEAQKQFELALQHNPDSGDALRDLVLTDFVQKKRDLAIGRVKAQIEKSPKNSAFYVLLASLQLDTKDLANADANVQKAMELDSKNAQAVSLFTRIQVMRGTTEKAIAKLQEWIKNKPDDAGAYVVLGTLEDSRKDLKAAQQYYEKALQLQPDQPLAANNLAYLMLNTGQNVDQALTLAQTARRAMPKSPSSADTLAWAYYHKGTYAMARDLLEDAVKENDQDANIQLHLGLVYQKLSDRTNATSHLKKVISLAPNSPQAEQARKALAEIG